MEKGSRKIIRIVVTGPESVAKTTISGFLAEKYGAVLIGEYARQYVEKLDRPYNYSDVEHIALEQIRRYNECQDEDCSLIIFDTWLDITRVWFEEVFNTLPEWFEDSLKKLNIDLYLLCKPDIDWIPDPVRENGGEKRESLFLRYEQEIKRSGTPYVIIGGQGEERLRNAAKALEEFLKKHENDGI